LALILLRHVSPVRMPKGIVKPLTGLAGARFVAAAPVFHRRFHDCGQ
jgi:hypothetical protein